MSPQPHVLAIPCPAQGHVLPTLEVAQRLAKRGLRITFVNTEHTQRRVMSAAGNMDFLGDQIHVVSIPDGMGIDEDRSDPWKVTEAMNRVMPGKLEELIQEINKKEEGKITCMLVDASMSWTVDVAVKMKIPLAVFWPASVAMLALEVAIPTLISEGVIADDGTPIGQQTFRLAPEMPSMSERNLVWMRTVDSALQPIFFDFMNGAGKAVKFADRVICNSSRTLEHGALRFIPEMKPVGPLLAKDRLGDSAGYFWAEDSSCLQWLDEQPPHSVVYVAFGSITVFDRIQFQELALGLELTGIPFLWVVRPGITEETNDLYPEGFEDRVSCRGKMVSWAAQQRVLSHPSIACFLSHCGWNSTMEATSNGVPVLCWPYFADQILNENYICDEWKTGLGFDRDISGIVTRDEIKLKVDKLLDSEDFISRAQDLKERVKYSVREGGESHRNFIDLVEWIKAL